MLILLLCGLFKCFIYLVYMHNIFVKQNMCMNFDKHVLVFVLKFFHLRKLYVLCLYYFLQNLLEAFKNRWE